MRNYRKLGLAEQLMKLSRNSFTNIFNTVLEDAMKKYYGAKFATLHVREGNHAALHLYRDCLNFR